MPLISHYDNTLIQYAANFTAVKMTILIGFFFLIQKFAQNIYCGYTLEPPQLAQNIDCGYVVSLFECKLFFIS